MKKIICLFSSMVTIIIMVLLSSMNVFAGDIVIDGHYNDWDEDSMDAVGGRFFSKVDMVVDDGMLYIYGKETGRNPWENYFSYSSPKIITNDGKEFDIALSAGGSINGVTQIVARKAIGYSEIKGAETFRNLDDVYKFEVKIPLGEYCDVKSVILNVDYNTPKEFIPKYPNSKDETGNSTEKPTKPEEENTTIEDITSDSDTIIIDGIFTDWESYPHVLDTNWNMPEEQRTEENCRTVGLVADDEYIYVHVKMISGWYDPFNSNFFNVTAGGKTIDVYLFTENGTPISQANLPSGTHNFIIRYNNGTPGMPDSTQIVGAEAVFVRKDHQPDEIEIKLPFDMFEKVYGIKREDIKEINVKNPNLFNQGITIAGSSTAPYIGIAICLIVATGSTVVYKKKNTLRKEK